MDHSTESAQATLELVRKHLLEASAQIQREVDQVMQWVGIQRYIDLRDEIPGGKDES